MPPAILCLRAEGFRLEGLSSFAPDGCYWVRETVGWVLQGATEGFKWRYDLSRLEGTGAGEGGQLGTVSVVQKSMVVSGIQEMGRTGPVEVVHPAWYLLSSR